MEMQLRFVIHWKKIIYDDLIVTPFDVTHFVKNVINNNPHGNAVGNERRKKLMYAPKYLNNGKINSYAVSAFVDTLKRSGHYRRFVMAPLLKCKKLRLTNNVYPAILINLRFPRKEFLDYKWGERIRHMAMERREVDHAMSWLSTLGGAFSALGDHFQHCAQMAGKISAYQFSLALRLGDPLLVARCKLYAALSIIQQGNLGIPKRLIRHIFEYAIQQKDIHLQRMCKGVWAKLRYCYKLRKLQKKILSD